MVARIIVIVWLLVGACVGSAMFLAPFPFGLVSFVCGTAGSIFILVKRVRSGRPKLVVAFVVGVVIPGGILSVVDFGLSLAWS